jgi:hypothetical protein
LPVPRGGDAGTRGAGRSDDDNISRSATLLYITEEFWHGLVEKSHSYGTMHGQLSIWKSNCVHEYLRILKISKVILDIKKVILI